MDKINQVLKRIEPYLFFFLVVISAWPVFYYRFFPTLDGAAHLANGNLINSLVFHYSAEVHKYVVFNPEPVPNWTGHLIIAISRIFLPAYLCEKIVILIYLIGLPYAFRWFLRTINKSTPLLSYLIIPFVYNYTFYLGFYNFSLSLVFFFITLAYWHKNKENLTIKKGALLFLLVTLTYFSHIFIFGILFISIGFSMLADITSEVLSNSLSLKESIRKNLLKVKYIALISCPGIILGLIYFYRHPSIGQGVFLSHKELLGWIKSVRPLIALKFDESRFSSKIFYVLFILFGIALYQRIRMILGKREENESFAKYIGRNLKSTDFLIPVIFICTLLYFVYPDDNGSASIISVRWLLMVYILLICWLASHSIPKFIAFTGIIICFVLHFALINDRSHDIKWLNEDAKKCEAAGNFLPAGVVVLPVNFSGLWLHDHFSNYLGINKPIILLENYECSKGYFPLKWDIDEFYTFKLPRGDTAVCVNPPISIARGTEQIPYIFTWMEKSVKLDHNQTLFVNYMNGKYDLIYANSDARLYKLKKQEL